MRSRSETVFGGVFWKHAKKILCQIHNEDEKDDEVTQGGGLVFFIPQFSQPPELREIVLARDFPQPGRLRERHLMSNGRRVSAGKRASAALRMAFR